MKEKNLLGALLEQIAELVKKIQTYDKPIADFTPETLEQLSTLEKAIEAFEFIDQQALQEANLDIKKLEGALSEFKNTPTKDMRILDRAKSVAREAKYLQLVLSQTIQKRSSNKKESLDPQKKLARDRQKKLKRLGGDGWIRL